MCVLPYRLLSIKINCGGEDSVVTSYCDTVSKVGLRGDATCAAPSKYSASLSTLQTKPMFLPVLSPHTSAHGFPLLQSRIVWIWTEVQQHPEGVSANLAIKGEQLYYNPPEEYKGGVICNFINL